MFSLKNLENNLVRDVLMISFNELKPHEKVVSKRKEALKNYILSMDPEIIISSIIICSETKMIIDGHHRYFALIELGFLEIPVTMVNYSSDKIKAYYDDRIEKEAILNASLNGILLPPKSSKHIILDESNNTWYPLILLSSLFFLK